MACQPFGGQLMRRKIAYDQFFLGLSTTILGTGSYPRSALLATWLIQAQLDRRDTTSRYQYILLVKLVSVFQLALPMFDGEIPELDSWSLFT